MLRSSSISSLDDPDRHPLLKGVGIGLPHTDEGLVPVANNEVTDEKKQNRSYIVQSIIMDSEMISDILKYSKFGNFRMSQIISESI